MKYINKNLTILTIAVLFGVLGFVSPALAATDFTLSLPAGTNYEVGDTFKANLVISPAEKIYTVGAQLSYPADLLKVDSFSFASTWMPLSQSGYDSIDNTSGLLIKTAGYAGGTDSPKTLGTVTFRVLNSGQATIQFTSDTFVLNANSANVVGTLSSSQLTFSAAEIIPGEEEEEEVIPEEEEVIPEEEEVIPEEEEVIPEEEVTPEEELPEEEAPGVGLLAAIIAIPLNLKIILIIVGVVIIGLIVFWLIRRKRIKS